MQCNPVNVTTVGNKNLVVIINCIFKIIKRPVFLKLGLKEYGCYNKVVVLTGWS